MKIVVKYKLPEDEIEFKWARDGYKRWSQLRDLDEQIRSWRKHGCNLSTEELLERIAIDFLPHDLHD